MLSIHRPAVRLLLLLIALAAPGCAAAGRSNESPPISRRAPGAGGIPVLAWHFFKDAPKPEDSNLTESWARYEEMLVFLKSNGFRSVFPEEARLPGEGGGREVILTFDDGHEETMRAAEILEKHGFRGIFFVIPNRTRPDGRGFLTPDEVSRLARAGHRVSAHGYDHRSLATSGTEVAASLVRSPRMMAGYDTEAEAALDFAFPFGHYTAEVAEAIGGRYRHLHTVNPGYWDGASPLLPRMLIMSDVELTFFQDYVLGAPGHRPVLEPLSSDGSLARQAAFRARGPLPDTVLLLAISPDSAGRSYAAHPLGQSLRRSGDTVSVDLEAHLQAYYPPGRTVLSYALVARDGDGVRYLTPGLLHWLRDPASWRPSPPPAVSPPGGRGQ